MGLNDALKRAGNDFADQAEMKALAQKRNTLLNTQRRIEAIDYLKNIWADDPARGLKALLVGVQKQRMGARASAGGWGRRRPPPWPPPGGAPNGRRSGPAPAHPSARHKSVGAFRSPFLDIGDLLARRR